jgi:uncharacterized cupredoxin-like copper-binding protein
MMHGVRNRLAAALIAVVSVLGAVPALTGCGATQATPPRPTVRVNERDFRISAPKRVQAGDVRLLIHNKGPDSHELLLVRGSKSRLPFRSDGLGIDEDKLGSALVAVLEPAEVGTHELDVHLEPGRYRLICNMSGHYMGGMAAEFVVV